MTYILAGAGRQLRAEQGRKLRAMWNDLSRRLDPPRVHCCDYSVLDGDVRAGHLQLCRHAAGLLHSSSSSSTSTVAAAPPLRSVTTD